MGNTKANRFWEARLPPDHRKACGRGVEDIAGYIREKYIGKKFAATEVPPPSMSNYTTHPYVVEQREVVEEVARPLTPREQRPKLYDLPRRSSTPPPGHAASAQRPSTPPPHAVRISRLNPSTPPGGLSPALAGTSQTVQMAANSFDLLSLDGPPPAAITAPSPKAAGHAVAMPPSPPPPRVSSESAVSGWNAFQSASSTPAEMQNSGWSDFQSSGGPTLVHHVHSSPVLRIASAQQNDPFDSADDLLSGPGAPTPPPTTQPQADPFPDTGDLLPMVEPAAPQPLQNQKQKAADDILKLYDVQEPGSAKMLPPNLGLPMGASPIPHQPYAMPTNHVQMVQQPVANFAVSGAIPQAMYVVQPGVGAPPHVGSVPMTLSNFNSGMGPTQVPVVGLHQMPGGQNHALHPNPTGRKGL